MRINVHMAYIHICVCLCVYVCDCLGSQRVTEPEFDEGTAVMSKGGWGLFLSVAFSVCHKLYFYLWCCHGGCLIRTDGCADRRLKLDKKDCFIWLIYIWKTVIKHDLKCKLNLKYANDNWSFF